MSRRSRDTLSMPLIGCVGHDCAACRAKEAKSALTRAEATILRSAALQLIDWARITHDSQTDSEGNWDNGCGQAMASKALHDRHMRTAKRLREIANRYAPPKNATKKVGALSSQGEEV
jgi:hypothetical protein